jgi:type II secretory pathway pseudopilin PulG
MNKKGSLNLSIQMIVIVVIAFVVLGLGLGFVRTQFSSISDTSTQVQKQIEQQVLDDLRRGNQKLSFPTDELILGTGEDTVQAIGIKNTKDQPLTLRMGFEVKTVSGFDPFTSEKQKDIVTVSDINTVSTIIWNSENQNFPPGEARVIPVTITAPDKIGTYLYKVVVYEVNAGVDGEVFDERTFFIKTS